MAKRTAKSRDDGPSFRQLGEGDFEADGLPNVGKFGPLQQEYDDRAGGWYARYKRLPAYLGFGATPDEAVARLVSAQGLRATPIYQTPTPQTAKVRLLREIDSDRKALFAASKLKNRSSYGVEATAKEFKVRKQAVSKADISISSLSNSDTVKKAFEKISGHFNDNSNSGQYIREVVERNADHWAEEITSEQHRWVVASVWARQQIAGSGR